jgi:hypothetical protein
MTRPWVRMDSLARRIVEDMSMGRGTGQGSPCRSGKGGGMTAGGQHLAIWYFLRRRPRVRRSIWAARAAWVTLPWVSFSSALQ